MSKFILDRGSPAGAVTFDSLDTFCRGYVEAMFFTSTGYAENDDLETASVDELAPEALARIKRDCEAFQAIRPVDLKRAANRYRPKEDDSADAMAGRDFWFSRNGHGVGFWDRGLGAVGDSLHSTAQRFGSVDLYRGDDGRLHIASGGEAS